MNVNARHAINRNRANGFHYFDPDTLAFFGSIVHKGYNDSAGATYVVVSNRCTLDGAFGQLVADCAPLFGEVPPSTTDRSSLPAGGERYYVVVKVDLDGRTTNVSHPGATSDEAGWPSHTTADNYARALAAR